ncbi:phosphatase PAP2 family protein [Pontibacter chitinilyticus]|uniref:phosphatase PAP2 family protein n=1 Tax=Pontibacter chitinilyticus TaxID=2674989 RepID=UPI00321B3DF8
MKRLLSILTILILFGNQAYCQDDSPYTTSLKVDAPVIAAGMGLSYYGLTLMHDKEGLTDAEANALQKSNVNGFDRFSAGWHSESAKNISNYPLYGSLAAPVVMLLNDNIRSKAGQVLMLYVETMAVTGTIFTLTNGNVPRIRPLAYSPDAALSDKTSANAKNAFFAGHTAATASATFFVAKIFNDFNPDSRARPYVWAAAAAVPATVGYMRLWAGKHFLSDNLVGYAVGAATGILVPQLHKKANKTNISLVPISSPEYNGAVLTYTF